MAVTQNGWSTIEGQPLDKSPIPGTDVVPVPGLRQGDVATVLLHVGKLFNERVDPVYNPGCWGYNAPSYLPGSTIIHNHASGTAIDLNAPSFPHGKRTMSVAQREGCRDIANELGVISWGGDWNTTIDEMHFEIMGDEAQVAEVANKIRGDDMVTMSQEEILSAFRSLGVRGDLPNGDPSQKQLDDYSSRDARYMLDDFLNYKVDRLREAENSLNSTRKRLSELQAQVDSMKGTPNAEAVTKLKEQVDKTSKEVGEAVAALEKSGELSGALLGGK